VKNSHVFKTIITQVSVILAKTGAKWQRWLLPSVQYMYTRHNVHTCPATGGCPAMFKYFDVGRWTIWVCKKPGCPGTDCKLVAYCCCWNTAISLQCHKQITSQPYNKILCDQKQCICCTVHATLQW